MTLIRETSLTQANSLSKGQQQQAKKKELF
jgi:hypothetical protein